MMKFYFSPGSVSLAAHIALVEADAKFEAIRIDFATEQQRSERYLSINPKGRVPALVMDAGVLTETPAILMYIATVYSRAKLVPFDDPFAVAKVNAFLSYLASTVHVAHAHGGRGPRWASKQSSFDDMKAKVPQTMRECFLFIEEELVVGPWVMGEQYSICDAYLLTISRWLEGDGVERSDFVKVDRHAALMREREPVRRAWEAHFDAPMP